MAFDAPRKTLDEIRRELDAEYSSFVNPLTCDGAPGLDLKPDQPFDDKPPSFEQSEALIAEDQRVAPRRPSRRLGYIVAGVLGCVVGQLAVLGFFGLGRDQGVDGSSMSRSLVPLNEAAPYAGAAAIGLSSDGDASMTSGAVGELLPPRDAVVAEPPHTTVSPRPVSPPATLAGDSTRASRPLRRATVAPAVKPEAPPRNPDAPPRVTAPPPITEPLAEPEDEVRTALRAWLASSGVADERVVADTVVSMRADGQVAKTYIPIRSDGRVVIREQIWRRGTDGWHIAVDGEASQVREGPADSRLP